MKHHLAAAVLAFLALPVVFAPGVRADAPVDLKWSQLMPPIDPAQRKPKTFFSGATPQAEMNAQGANQPPMPDQPAGGEHEGPLPPSSYQEGAFMSMKRRQPGANLPPRVVKELDGKRVRIGGYVVPLDFEATTIKEFLLVPFVGACIHVPPPPANQIIYVKAEEGFEIAGQFDPVWVTGTITTEPAITGLADTGYTIAAEEVDRRKE
ncbi:DUF3299 domain-containing protein [Hyphomicrobium sp. D-2]|uniref:DUF3299 domain-containing protein n=1 Tax=Hyphomicrobium sp. D-2 TaxID=3041621 RepID=UPI0024558A75|nr:DUF3299 domain-containing protein [Hyphomicrobium sp. D-2]MDH4983159.1 DUF3299 domain-containing protein [Hyphomicrobium sp. D-2]